jgi:peptidoglycan/xylan/chitin deacetylase (PgdA/CDA1 family)
MSNRKPLASLSLDLDNKWSYMKTHGDAGWTDYPTYLPIVVPRVLRFLKERNLKITFFIVGQDAVRDENREALQAIVQEGHEVGNHSFHHEPWLHLYSNEQLAEELTRAEESIERVTGRRPIGFRGPGFSLSKTTLEVLARRGYKYDASTFPTYLGPLARAYYFWTSHLDAKEKQQRKLLFGAFNEGFRPLQPYRWRTQSGPLTEIPVTTMPWLKIPIHASYLLYLGMFAPKLALGYFRMAVRACTLAGVQLSLLLHPLDFLGCDDCNELAFFPAMTVPHKQKVELVGQAIDMLTQQFNVLPMQGHATALGNNGRLPLMEPKFNHGN